MKIAVNHLELSSQSVGVVPMNFGQQRFIERSQKLFITLTLSELLEQFAEQYDSIMVEIKADTETYGGIESDPFATSNYARLEEMTRSYQADLCGLLANYLALEFMQCLFDQNSASQCLYVVNGVLGVTIREDELCIECSAHKVLGKAWDTFSSAAQS